MFNVSEIASALYRIAAAQHGRTTEVTLQIFDNGEWNVCTGGEPFQPGGYCSHGYVGPEDLADNCSGGAKYLLQEALYEEADKNNQ